MDQFFPLLQTYGLSCNSSFKLCSFLTKCCIYLVLYIFPLRKQVNAQNCMNSVVKVLQTTTSLKLYLRLQAILLGLACTSKLETVHNCLTINILVTIIVTILLHTKKMRNFTHKPDNLLAMIAHYIYRLQIIQNGFVFQQVYKHEGKLP